MADASVSASLCQGGEGSTASHSLTSRHTNFQSALREWKAGCPTWVAACIQGRSGRGCLSHLVPKERSSPVTLFCSSIQELPSLEDAAARSDSLRKPPAESGQCLRRAVEMYTSMGRLGMAARHLKVHGQLRFTTQLRPVASPPVPAADLFENSGVKQLWGCAAVCFLSGASCIHLQDGGAGWGWALLPALYLIRSSRVHCQIRVCNCGCASLRPRYNRERTAERKLMHAWPLCVSDNVKTALNDLRTTLRPMTTLRPCCATCIRPVPCSVTGILMGRTVTEVQG